METCRLSGQCGGCLYQGIDYEEQVLLKADTVRRYIAEKKMKTGRFVGIEGSPVIYCYRNKMEYTFGNLEKDGEMTLGLHKRGQYMSILNVDECQLVHSDFNIIVQAILEFCRKNGYQHYHKKKHNGLMRNLVIRRSERYSELLINVVTTSAASFDEQGFLDMVLALPLENSVAGVLHTVNDNISDRVTNEACHILYGRDYYRERVMGLEFHVSAFSFFQTNVAAVERLYTEALSLIDDIEGKTVFDLYCGTGTMTQAIALKAKKAVGVEINGDAVNAARKNAKLNGLENCEFIAGDVLDVLDTISDEPDVIVVDPPRSGIHHKALPKIVRYGVNQILYVSCNPKTLVENLRFMEEHGYVAGEIKAYDNFPFTEHVETVVLMSKV